MAAPSAPMLGSQKKATLDTAVFSEPFHESLVHETAMADLAARRRGTASTLSRGQVAMTTAKAWRQKGTGRARAGALSVPHRRGGGVAFGPKPRQHAMKVNKKARRRALRAALSLHAGRGTLAVLPDGTFDEPATKTAAELLAKWAQRQPTLVVVSGDDETGAALSFRNIPRVAVLGAGSVGVADVVGAASLLLTEASLPLLAARAGDVNRAAAGTAAGESDSGPEA